MTDFGNNYATDGQNWDDVNSKFGIQPGTIGKTVGTTTTPFLLDFGSGPQSFQAQPNLKGQVIFLDSLGQPTADFINVAFPALAWGPISNFSQTSGVIDRSYVENVATNFGNPAAGLTAYRYLWNFVCQTNDTSCNGEQFEVTFIPLSTEAFILQFDYGSDEAINNVNVGFTLGKNTDPIFTGATIDGEPGPQFCFNNGIAGKFSSIAACLTGTATTVPEPDVRSLVLLGGLLLVAGGVVRRRQFAQHASI